MFSGLQSFFSSNPEALRNAYVMFAPASKTSLSHQRRTARQPAPYHDVSMLCPNGGPDLHSWNSKVGTLDNSPNVDTEGCDQALSEPDRRTIARLPSRARCRHLVIHIQETVDVTLGSILSSMRSMAMEWLQNPRVGKKPQEQFHLPWS